MQTYHLIELEDLDSELQALSPPPTVLNRKLKDLKKNSKKYPHQKTQVLIEKPFKNTRQIYKSIFATDNSPSATLKTPAK